MSNMAGISGMINRVVVGDCLDELPKIESGSVDLILIDPPYNISKDTWDKWKSVKDYVKFMGFVFAECERVLKDNGSFYFFHNDFLQIVELQNWLNQNSKLVFKQLITWSKISESFSNYGFVQQRLSVDMGRNYYNGFTEYCLFYTFQDETGLSTVMLDINNFPTLRKYFKDLQDFIGFNKKQILAKIGQCADHCFRWNSTQWGMPTPETYQQLIDIFGIREWDGFREYESQKQGYESLRQGYEGLRQEYESLRYKFNVQNVKKNLRSNSNVWLYPPAPNMGHITPKPIELIENIIKHSSNEGDVILDCFAGSGTTLVAAKQLGRKFIGIEIDEAYCRIAEERLSQSMLEFK